jgi:hypothetical protein
LKGRKGPRIAVKAGARKIAVAFYFALTRGMDYVEEGAAKYQERFIQREMIMLHKLANRHNLTLVENQLVR